MLVNQTKVEQSGKFAAADEAELEIIEAMGRYEALATRNGSLFVKIQMSRVQSRAYAWGTTLTGDPSVLDALASIDVVVYAQKVLAEIATFYIDELKSQTT